MRPPQAELLKKYGLRLDKSLGQHFLVDRPAVERIVNFVIEQSPETVIEMGAGAGALTFPLLDAGLRVRALEIDPRLVELLRAEGDPARLEVVTCDLADTDFLTHLPGPRTMFVGNLPYQVTSPILFGLMPALRQPEALGALVMMQREVATRLMAGPGSKEYGVLSVLGQAEWQVESFLRVKPGCFLPPPAVDSTVLWLAARADRVALGDTGRALVKTLFQQRRKQIGGLLRSAYDLSREQVETLPDQLGLAPTQRCETLALEDFVNLDRWIRDRTAG